MNIPLDEWSGSKATKELEATIKRLNEGNAGSNKVMLLLTGAGAFFALVAAVASVIQVLK